MRIDGPIPSSNPLVMRPIERSGLDAPESQRPQANAFNEPAITATSSNSGNAFGLQTVLANNKAERGGDESRAGISGTARASDAPAPKAASEAQAATAAGIQKGENRTNGPLVAGVENRPDPEDQLGMTVDIRV